MNFSLKTPCSNCPFRAVGAIQLHPGRVPGIIKTLENDFNFFHCHKTVHNKKGGEWDDDTGEYKPSGNESVCPGSLAYMYREGYLPIVARLAISAGDLKKSDLEKLYPILIEKRNDRSSK